jgi:nucleotide-binding universal stress UspA family protein
VRPVEAREDGAARVVVGVDGSDHARHALRWALDEARLRKAHLDVVTAWQLPLTGGIPSAAAVDPIVYERAAERIVADAIATENTTDVATLIAPRALAGHPADVLLDAAAAADLLVVGSRGHGAFKRALLGSVATHVSHHATCPVVVIPAPKDSTP